MPLSLKAKREPTYNWDYMRKSGPAPLTVMSIESRREGIQKNLLEWGKRNFRQFPWRQKRTPYSVLVSELLLKRTTATAAKRVFGEFMRLYPNLQTLSLADAEDLENLLSKIGYHKLRTKIFIGLANYLLSRHCGDIPRSKIDLLEIPNIGDYTANAILSLGYGVPSAMVDSNVERILRRLFLKNLSKRTRGKIQQVADLLAPTRCNQSYNYALLDLGALICRYGVPHCNLCPISRFCDYYSLGMPCSVLGRQSGHAARANSSDGK